MINCYGIIGILEVIASFVSYYAVFNGYGFKFEDLVGTALFYYLPYNSLNDQQ